MISSCFIQNSAISFTIMFILSKLNGNTCNVYNTTCLASCPTIRRVHACPVNDEEKKEREKRMACEKITQTCSEPHLFKYHCIIDERGDLMEICAPMVCILGHSCAEFNLGGGLVQERFDRNCTSCPFKYDSSTLYKYPECFPHSKYSNRSSKKTETRRSSTNRYSILIVFVILGLVILVSFSIFLYFTRTNQHVRQNDPDSDMLCA